MNIIPTVFPQYFHTLALHDSEMGVKLCSMVLKSLEFNKVNPAETLIMCLINALILIMYSQLALTMTRCIAWPFCKTIK